MAIAVAGASGSPAPAGDIKLAPAAAQSLCNALLDCMKHGSSLDFAGRKELVGRTVTKDFDLPFMTGKVVGPPWRTFSAEDREALIKAFTEISVASYASEFKGYGGQSFQVDPQAATMGSGLCVVHTRLLTGNTTVELDYVEHPVEGGWKIIDVLLNGSISQLAARRSEYAATLRRGGPEALIKLMRTKAGDMSP
ncbi:MAG TPA: ABC transporter substrate-binding protein [Opitutaceae bacterium]